MLNESISASATQQSSPLTTGSNRFHGERSSVMISDRTVFLSVIIAWGVYLKVATAEMSSGLSNSNLARARQVPATSCVSRGSRHHRPEVRVGPHQATLFLTGAHCGGIISFEVAEVNDS